MSAGMKMWLLVLGIAISLLTSCRQTPASQEVVVDTVVKVSVPVIDYDTAQWKELTTDLGFIVDIRYATSNNFVNEVIYPCGRCFVKPYVADALTTLQHQLKTQGYAIKLFDCYRPSPAQQKLWNKVPDKNYVAPPWEGSMHSRGIAVDLTLASLDGKELDMGTTYDFFGPEAHHTYKDFSKEIMDNRHLLKNSMEKAGFQHIRTEWWHYSFGKTLPPLEDWEWKCDK